MHPTVVVGASCLAVCLARVFIMTHTFQTPTVALPVRACREAPAAVLHLRPGKAIDLDELPSSLAGAEVVLLVDDGVPHARVVKSLDALAQRRASVVLQGRDDRCARIRTIDEILMSWSLDR